MCERPAGGGIAGNLPRTTTGCHGVTLVSELIHPTAVIDPSARIDSSAVIGAGAVIEADVIIGPNVVIGARTRLRTRCIIVENTTMGEDNEVHPYAVLGGDPQDRAMDPNKRNAVIIGDRNIFREGCTVHRGTGDGPPTRIGSGCMLMVQSHVGHNAQVGDRVVMANAASLAGHARVGNGVVMSAYCGVHQFCNVGEGVMFRGGAGTSMHVPPWVVVAETNGIAGLNRVGLRRNPAMSPKDREEIKSLYRAIYRERHGKPLLSTLADLIQRAWGEAARNYLTFLWDTMNEAPPRRRGLIGERSRARVSWADADAE
jgi:UDP-N-acetylglucosamine acyltransferase